MQADSIGTSWSCAGSVRGARGAGKVPFRNIPRLPSSAVAMPMLTRRQLRGWLLLLLTVVAVGLTVGLAVEARIATDRHHQMF